MNVLLANPGADRNPKVVACSCGEKPKQGVARMSMMHVWYMRHARKHGIEVDNVSHAVYGPGMAGAGMTWNEWYAKNKDTGASPWDGAQPV
jgi:hypothetical protein